MHTASEDAATAGPYSRIDLEDDLELWDYGGTGTIVLPPGASSALPLLLDWSRNQPNSALSNFRIFNKSLNSLSLSVLMCKMDIKMSTIALEAQLSWLECHSMH